MPWFRKPPPLSVSPVVPPQLTVDDIGRVVADCLRPENFVAAPLLRLEYKGAAREEIAWEVFRGRLLAPNQTRLQHSFETWNVYCNAGDGASTGPLVSVKFDAAARCLHVTRGFACVVWEGYDAGAGVMLSRQRSEWVSELVGTIDPADLPGPSALADELICRLFQAFAGTSRLPLTSSESPLPQFSLGQVHYLYRPQSSSGGTERPRTLSTGQLARTLAGPELAWPEVVKAAEFVVRATPISEAPSVAAWLVRSSAARGSAGEGAFRILRAIFNDAALTPYTDFVPKALAVAAALAADAPAGTLVDFLGSRIRQLVRHLTAYDLITFHHRGANYPDALLLDAALRALLAEAERAPALFLAAPSQWPAQDSATRPRRRALRQGLLLRRFYEGLPVPDAPTSPGENTRILPPPFRSVPEEQISDPSRRRRFLYPGEPTEGLLTATGRQLLAAALADLADPRELRELGTGLFIDRPLGACKAVGEPDQTPLLSYVAFSRAIAEHRLTCLADTAGWLSAGSAEHYRALLASLPVAGVPARAWVGRHPTAGVSVADALRVSNDFVFQRTTAGTLSQLLGLFDFPTVAQAGPGFDWVRLVARAPGVGALPGSLALFDGLGNRRLELVPETDRGWQTRAGVEYPRAGLRVIGAWTEDGAAVRLASAARVPIREPFRPWSDA